MTTASTLQTKHPFVVGMDPGHVDILFHGAVVQEFAPGEIIFREGAPADAFYLVEYGEVALEAHTKARGPVPILTVGANEVLGWSWLFAPFAWHFDAHVLKPTRVIRCDGAHLLVASEEDHEFGHEILKRVAHLVIHRLQETRRRLLQAEARIAQLEGVGR